ncbi:MAG: type I-U CRISPR-associated RAMP protein Csb1/Cas7u [Candidatus Binataceae bacterium]|jgi:CRISPR-associated protein Csb1
MNELLRKFDTWLQDAGPAALVLREHLMSVEGPDGVVFPATFAASQDGSFKGGYNVDHFSEIENICLIDSVGSQANRIEPLFAEKDYAGLVPQVVVKAGDKSVNLLEAGHRAGDAIVRCSALQEELQTAFRAVQNGNAALLAKIAPTSLVFGAWDSRDTQAKLPRLIASTIRAFNVRELTRSAQYVPAAEYVGDGLLDEPADKKRSDAYAERGFVHVPASGAPGGVIVTAGIRRDASLHLAALRLLVTGEDQAKMLVLRRYILGLALTAFTYSPSAYLRQGCNLVLDPDKPREFAEVYSDGHRIAAKVTHDEALEYARASASDFGVGKNRSVEFDRERAKRDVSGDAGNGERKARKSRSRTAL